MRVTIAAGFVALAACNRPDAPARNDAAAEAASIPRPPAAPEPASAPTGRSSQFTALDEKACKTTHRDAETGDWTGQCPGLGPIALELSSGDLRDDFGIIQGGKKTQLGIPAIVANGAFDSIGKTLEWRGPAGRAPDVLVARVHVARPDGTSDSGRLAIVWLGEKPCIVAVVPPQPGQSEKARVIADGKLPACLES